MTILTPSRDLTEIFNRSLEISAAQALIRIRSQARMLTVENMPFMWPVIGPDVVKAITQAQESSVLSSLWYLEQTIQTTTNLPAVLAGPEAQVGRMGSGAPVSRYVARTPDIVAVRVAGGMDTDLALGMSQRTLTALSTTEPFRLARQVVAQISAESPSFVGWQRIAEPGACSFCLMLASRGGAYRSRESASVGSKALRYHRNCRCRAEPTTSVAQSAKAATKNFPEYKPSRFAALRAPRAKTPERLSSINLQLSQIEERLPQMQSALSNGDASLLGPIEFSLKRADALRAEIAAFN
jgi:hypothetical protein